MSSITGELCLHRLPLSVSHLVLRNVHINNLSSLHASGLKLLELDDVTTDDDELEYVCLKIDGRLPLLRRVLVRNMSHKNVVVKLPDWMMSHVTVEHV